MQDTLRSIGAILALTFAASAGADSGQTSSAAESTATRTLKLLVEKGLITKEEVDAIVAEGLPLAAAKKSTPLSTKWSAEFYGFASLDAIYDSTQSYGDQPGNRALAKPASYAGTHGRMTFSARNSRFGFRLSAPAYKGIRASAKLEADFRGNQSPDSSESTVFTSPLFRARNFYLLLETPYIDFLAGQDANLFGWQTGLLAANLEYQGVVGQIYGRTPQLRLSRTFKTDTVNVSLAIAALRPPERDSSTPDGQLGVKVELNKWRAQHTGGSTNTKVTSSAIGLSGVVRRFEARDYLNPRSTSLSQSATGWGISVDALVAIIPVASNDRSNALTFTGSFVRGDGISDLYSGLNGGFPAPADSAGQTIAIDSGLVGYDDKDNLTAIGWRSFILGLQYYFPGGGNVFLTASYAQLNLATPSLATTLVGAKPASIVTQSQYVDAVLFWDATPAIRFALGYAFTRQIYASSTPDMADVATNHRVHFSAFYLF